MGYAILRTQKLKSMQSVRRSLKHSFREQETPNADPTRTPENTHIGANTSEEAIEKIKARLPEKIRKNGVLAIEYLVTASPDDLHAKSRKEQDDYFSDAKKWLEEKHGAENVVYAGIHRDETTPHMYAYVVPIDSKGKLNCRAFLGGAKALSEMQTDFADRVGIKHKLERGIEGSRAKHSQKWLKLLIFAFTGPKSPKTLNQGSDKRKRLLFHSDTLCIILKTSSFFC